MTGIAELRHVADGNFSSAYNARFCNSALYARRAHNAREFFCRWMLSVVVNRSNGLYNYAVTIRVNWP